MHSSWPPVGGRASGSRPVTGKAAGVQAARGVQRGGGAGRAPFKSTGPRSGEGREARLRLKGAEGKRSSDGKQAMGMGRGGVRERQTDRHLHPSPHAPPSRTSPLYQQPKLRPSGSLASRISFRPPLCLPHLRTPPPLRAAVVLRFRLLWSLSSACWWSLASPAVAPAGAGGEALRCFTPGQYTPRSSRGRLYNNSRQHRV